MPKQIYKLSRQVANLIAAGEVVERPGSVAKELIENAIDAGARSVTVEIKNGGMSYLRVTDDGSGIGREDARTAFMRHATSKIRVESDLLAIETLGFRGEALAAIASVSKVDLFTKTEDSDVGIHLSIEGGQEKDFVETGCPKGATIVVRDLFFNTPARMKFLKKDATEASYIESAVSHAALSRPDISFKLIKEGRESFFSSGDGKLTSAVYAVCGAECAGALLSVSGAFSQIGLSGLISGPGLTRANRNMQEFFVNDRYVRSRLLSAAVDEAYSGRLMSGRHPVCFLKLRVDPAAIDVNVHPSKLEVKFSRERDVFSAVYNSVSAALASHDDIMTMRAAKQTQRPALSVQKSGRNLTMQESLNKAYTPVAEKRETIYKTRADTGEITKNFFDIMSATPSEEKEVETAPAAYSAEARAKISVGEAKQQSGQAADLAAIPAPDPQTPDIEDILQFEPVRALGEALSTYILAQDQGGVWVIDKHAAHEKMLYEQLRQTAQEQPSQLLLVPVSLNLSALEKAACLEQAEALRQAGFEVEDFGQSALLVRQVPIYLEIGDVEFVISEIAGKILEQKRAHSELLEEILQSVACRAAVKAGGKTSPEELQAFTEKVLTTPEIRNCPHGRPVVVYLTKREIEKLFGRIR